MRPERWRREAHCIADLRRMAKRVLPRPIFDFADGGAQASALCGATSKRSTASRFCRVHSMERPNAISASSCLAVGFPCRSLLAPRALPALSGPGRASCRTGRSLGGHSLCLSHGSVCALEAIPSSDSPRWMQIFIYRDRGFTRELAGRASASGYGALVLTVDNQLLGRRERDLRNGFAIPPRYRAWRSSLWRPSSHGCCACGANSPHHLRQLRPARRDSPNQELAGRMARLLDPAMSWLTSTRCAPSGRGRWFLKASYTRLKPRRPWRVARWGGGLKPSRAAARRRCGVYRRTPGRRRCR